jgi:hypothetical protein
MKADYDSEADAILIDLADVASWDHEVVIDEAELCAVAFLDHEPVAVTLRYPREELHTLDRVAERFDLSVMALRAVTQAALAAPDHVVTVDVDPHVLTGSEAPTRSR